MSNFIEITESIYMAVQPFQEIPSKTCLEGETNDRLNAHDLFSFYTADIIKEDTIFIR